MPSILNTAQNLYQAFPTAKSCIEFVKETYISHRCYKLFSCFSSDRNSTLCVHGDLNRCLAIHYN